MWHIVWLYPPWCYFIFGVWKYSTTYYEWWCPHICFLLCLGWCFDSHFPHYPMSPSTTMSATFHDFVGCQTFSSCILLFHQYAVSAAIDNAANYGAHTLVEGLGLDFSIIDSHIAQVYSSGILDFIYTLSLECLSLSLHTRFEIILSPSSRIIPQHIISYHIVP